MKNILTLVIALVLFAGAWWFAAERRPQTEVVRETFIPELFDAVNSVAEITVRDANHTTRLVKQGDLWVVASSDGYPANFEKVKSMVLELASLRILEQKTNQPEKHARIGLAGVEEADSRAVEIDLSAEDGSGLAAILIGDEGKGGVAAARYVRLRDEDQSYLVAGTLDYAAEAREWMDNSIADIQPERVVEVSVAPEGAERFTLSRLVGEQGALMLEEIPEGFEERSRATTESMSTFLSQLRFDAVADAGKYADAPVAFEAHYLTREGVDVTVTGYEIDGETWVGFAAEHSASREIDDARLPTIPAAAMIMGPGAEQPEPTEFSGPEVAAALNARAAGWLYQVPSFKLSIVDRERSALVQPERERVEASNAEN